MNELAKFCRDLKKDFKPRNHDASEPVRCWSEKDVLNDKVVNAFVIIFKTRGCSWAFNSGCSMCGYFNDSHWKQVNDLDFLKQFETAMKNYSDESFIKIFNSGSFLDDKEIKPKLQKEILSSLFEKAEKVSIESRPEYITNKKLGEIKNIAHSKTFEIGIGLETSNDFVRNNSINKGFSFNDYQKAAMNMKKYGFKVKTYLLVKPLFLTEKESINDSINSIKEIKKFADTISLNPVNVQRNTVVEFLWKRRQYRPAWLWSVVEILREGKEIFGDNLIKCDIAGGGSVRGAHNCKLCDKKVIDAISSFSLNQKTNILDDLDCECKDKWFDQLDIENLTFGSLVDMNRT